MADDVTLGVSLEGDEGEATREADRLAQIFASAFERAAPEIGRTLGREIRKSFASARIGDSLGDSMKQVFDSASASARVFVADSLGNVTEGFKKMGDVGEQAGRKVESRLEALRNDTASLEAQAQGWRDTLKEVGADPRLLSGIERQIKVLQSYARDLEGDLQRGLTPDENRLRTFEVAFQRANQTIFREVGVFQTLLRNLNDTQRIEGNRLTQEQIQQNKERLQNAKIANSQYIVEQQGLNAQQLAETRIAGQRQLQAQRSFARVRVELVRFTFNQIRALERGISAVLRSSASVAAVSASKVGAALGKMGNLFRRSRTDLNEGLGSALRAREQSISRSFQRQEASIRRSVTQQTVILERFERAASTGVIGAATGRSRLGALFGGGAAIGGGFLLARQLREGFEETVNLNEALNKTAQIFGSATDQIVEFSNDSVEALFITRSEALAAASDFGIFGRAAGLTGTELSSFSTDLLQLATDLASFNNTSVDEAITALAAGLRGEQEPLRRFGILLDQAVLKQRALTEGIIATDRVLTPQERVLAAYSEILEQTAVQQGDAARTADDFANSSKRAGAALTETFGALASYAVPIATQITNRALPALQSLTRFIEGDVSPALIVLRNGLIGAAQALAALIAARAAIQVLQLLTIALRALLTPMGLFVALVAGAGAAIRIFSERSERFAAVMRGIVILFRNLITQGVSLAISGFQLLAGIIVNTVLPALATFARVVAGGLLTGISFVAGVIATYLIPAIERVVGFIVDTGIPAVVDFARAWRNELVAGLAIAAGALLVIVSPLSAVVAALLAVTAVIVALNTDIDGPLGNVLSTFQRFVFDVGRTLAGIGVQIYDALVPQVERAVDFITNAFNNIDLADVATTILGVVRTIGRVLGSIVSDPLFIQAVAGIIAAAIAIGANFIIGFIEGVQSNLGELGDLLGSALRLALNAAVEYAFSNPGTVIGIIAAAAATWFAAQAIMSVFTRAGQAGAAGFTKSFAAGIAAAPIRTAQFLDGLFGGAGRANAAVERAAARQAAAYNQAFDRALRDYSRLTGGRVPQSFVAGDATARDVQRIQRELSGLRSSMGEARAAGRLFQQGLSENFRGVANVAQGSFRAITRSSQREVGQVRLGFQQLTTSIGDSFARLRASGQVSGVALGNGVLAGFGAVLAGQQGGAIGLAGIFASAITAGLTTKSPAVAALVAGAGLLSKWWADRKREAEEAKAAVEGYTQAIANAGSFTGALDQISRSIADALVDLEGIPDDLLRNFSIQGLLTEIQLGTDPLIASFNQLAAVVGIPADQLERLTGDLDAYRDAQGNAIALANDNNRAFVRLSEALEGTGISVEDFLAAFDGIAGESSAVAQAIQDAGLLLALLGAETNTAKRALDSFGPSAGGAAAELAVLDTQLERITSRLEPGSALADVYGRSLERVTSRIEPLNDALRDTADASDESLGGLGRFVRSGRELISGVVDDIAELTGFDFSKILDIEGFINYLASLGATADDIEAELEETFNVNLDGLIADTLELDDALGDVAPKVDVVGNALRDLNDQRTNRIQAQIDQVQDRLDEATDAANRAREALTAFITGRYADTAQAQVDNLIGSIGSIGSEIEEALLLGGVRGDAALRSAVGGFESQLAAIIQAGFDDGLRTQEEFADLLAPLFAAIDEETGDAASRILSDVDFTAGITPQAGSELAGALNRVLAGRQIEVGVNGIMNAEAEVARIQSQLDSLNAELDVNVRFSVDQVRAAVEAAAREAGLDEAAIATLLGGVNQQSVADAQKSASAQTIAGAQTNVTVNDSSTTNITVPPGTTATAGGAATFIDALNAQAAGRPITVNGSNVPRNVS